MVIGTIGDGKHFISIANILFHDEYFALPTDKECRVVLDKLGFKKNKQRNHNVVR